MEAFYSGTVGIKGKHWPHVRPALTKPCTASNIQLSHSGMQKAMQDMVRFQPCPLPGRAVISPSACLPHTRHPQPTSHARPQPHFALDHKKPFSATHFSTHFSAPTRRTTPRRTRYLKRKPSHVCHALFYALLHGLCSARAPLYAWHNRPSSHKLTHALLRTHNHRLA